MDELTLTVVLFLVGLVGLPLVGIPIGYVYLKAKARQEQANRK